MDKRLYNIWSCMKQRCNNPNHTAAPWYHDKGIRVCPEWNDNYKEFESWALSHGYNPALTIDRIDSDRDYSPNNCQWITLEENQRRAKEVRNNTARHRRGPFMVVKCLDKKGFCKVIKIGLNKKDARKLSDKLNNELHRSGDLRTLYGVRVTDRHKEGQEVRLIETRYYLTDKVFPKEIVHADLFNEQNEIKEIVSLFISLPKEDRAVLLANANAFRVRAEIEKNKV